MSITICPRCHERIVMSSTNTDFVHQCNSAQEVLNNEDLPRTSNFEDYTGSATFSKFSINAQGTENILRGTEAGIEGNSVGTFTSRGANKQTHRTRQHLQYISRPNPDSQA